MSSNPVKGAIETFAVAPAKHDQWAGMHLLGVDTNNADLAIAWRSRHSEVSHDDGPAIK